MRCKKGEILMKNMKKAVTFALVAAVLLVGGGELITTLGAQPIYPPIITI